MAAAIKAIFSPAKAEGPNKELLQAQRAQEARIKEKEEAEETKLAARKKVLKGLQGGSIATLFKETGETGIPEKLGT